MGRADRRRNWAALALSSTVLVAAPGAWGVTRPDPPEPASGDEPAAEAPGSPFADERWQPIPSVLLPAASPGHAPEPPPLLVGDEVPTSSARVDDRAAPSPPPRRLRIPRLGVDAPVVGVGVATDGRSVEVPGDVHDVGWYRHGPAPAAPEGSAVLLGHVDSREQGPGAFFTLDRLEPGDRVEVELQSGTLAPFEVTARRTYAKDALPSEQVFTPYGERILTLITCGGTFDGTRRSYADNVVVYARPL